MVGKQNALWLDYLVGVRERDFPRIRNSARELLNNEIQLEEIPPLMEQARAPIEAVYIGRILAAAKESPTDLISSALLDDRTDIRVAGVVAARKLRARELVQPLLDFILGIVESRRTDRAGEYAAAYHAITRIEPGESRSSRHSLACASTCATSCWCFPRSVAIASCARQFTASARTTSSAW